MIKWGLIKKNYMLFRLIEIYFIIRFYYLRFVIDLPAMVNDTELFLIGINNKNNNNNSCAELNNQMKLKLCGAYFLLVDGGFNVTLNSYWSFGKKRLLHQIMRMKLFIKIQMNIIIIAPKGVATLLIFHSFTNVFPAV